MLPRVLIVIDTSFPTLCAYALALALALPPASQEETMHGPA